MLPIRAARGVAVADLDVAVAGLPAADAIEEVAGVQAGRRAALDGAWLDLRLGADAVASFLGAVDRRAGREFVGGDVVGHHFVAVAS